MTPRSPPPPPWSLADLVDFEWLLAGEETDSTPAWRAAWKRSVSAGAPDGAPSRRALFREWLEFRRAESGTDAPGRALVSGWRWAVVTITVAGVLLGGGVTGTLLHYRGAEPVNVGWFLACTLGIQWLFLCGAVALAVLRRFSNAFSDFGPVRQLVSGLAWAFGSGVRRLPGERRNEIRSWFARLERKREIYGTLTVWPAVVLAQLLAVGYNVGILAVLLAHVAATDLAFGWQSTLELSPEAAHRIAATVASPWSWFAPLPSPNLDQVVGSRFSYSRGMAGLDRQALASWWPFLAYSVAAYGLLVRVVLLAAAAARLRSAIHRWPFDHEACNTLARRLLGPVVLAENVPTPVSLSSPSPPEPTTPSSTSGTCFTLVADDLETPDADVPGIIRTTLGLDSEWLVRIAVDHPSGNQAAIEALGSLGEGPVRVVIVAPAHRAPIVAIALALHRLIEAAGPHREVILLLLGRPCVSGSVSGSGSASSRAAVPDESFRHWRQLVTLHRLRVGLERAPATP